jgi:hypothetical protein
MDSESNESELDFFPEYISEVKNTTTTSVNLNLPSPSKWNLRHIDQLMQEILLFMGTSKYLSPVETIKGFSYTTPIALAIRSL